METRTDILNELKALSPLLAGLEKLNVFSVPAGYFDGLADGCLAAVKEEDSAVIRRLSKDSLSKENFSKDVPAGYFDNLADTILGKIKMQEARESLSPMLQGLRAVNPFQVPAGYFDNLSEDISKNLLVQTAEEELKTFSPALQYLQKENVYEVPKGYFDQLSDELLSKVNEGAAKLVRMPKRRNFVKYAVAAALTGILAFGGYKLLDSKNATKKSGTVALTPPVKHGLEMSGDSTRQEAEYAKLSDQDIVNFLESSGQEIEMASLSENIDTKELPNQEDYLLDEKTLDNFLNDLNLEGKDLNN